MVVLFWVICILYLDLLDLDLGSGVFEFAASNKTITDLRAQMVPTGVGVGLERRSLSKPEPGQAQPQPRAGDLRIKTKTSLIPLGHLGAFWRR